jgi:hypothetical protein
MKKSCFVRPGTKAGLSGATTGNIKQGGAAHIFTADSWRSAVLVVSFSGQAFLPTESVKYES